MLRTELDGLSIFSSHPLLIAHCLDIAADSDGIIRLSRDVAEEAIASIGEQAAQGFFFEEVQL
jgi:hypothetical protein